MFLSNLRKCLLYLPVFALILQGCGSAPANENRAVDIKADVKSEFPFSTKEPEVYQGEFVAGDAVRQDKWFVARKGDKWRLDFFANGELIRSQVKNDRMFVIDHANKTYTSTVSGSDSEVFAGMSQNFFGGKEYREFEELSRTDGLIKYRVNNPTTAAGEILIDIDSRSGMMVRQEFTSGTTKFVFEIRGLRTEVDDAVFAIPAGYREGPSPVKKTR